MSISDGNMGLENLKILYKSCTNDFKIKRQLALALITVNTIILFNVTLMFNKGEVLINIILLLSYYTKAKPGINEFFNIIPLYIAVSTGFFLAFTLYYVSLPPIDDSSLLSAIRTQAIASWMEGFFVLFICSALIYSTLRIDNANTEDELD